MPLAEIKRDMLKLEAIQERRIRRLQNYMSKRNGDYDAMILSDPDNIRYFTGQHLKEIVYNKVIVPRDDDPVGITSILLYTPLKEEANIAEENIHVYAPYPHFEGIYQKNPEKLLEDLTKDYKKILRDSSGVKLKGKQMLTDNIVSKLRKKKSSDELCFIRKACERTRNVMVIASNIIADLDRYGIKTEQDLSLRLDKELQGDGYGLAFNTIVASGSHSRRPHDEPGLKSLGEKPVIVDIGASYLGFTSDMTRTFNVEYDSGLYDVKQYVVESLRAGKKCLKECAQEGGTYGDVSKAIHEVLKDHGIELNLEHADGHSTGGVNVHDGFRIVTDSKDKVEDGDVVAIEPAVYLEEYGYRIENTYAIVDGKVVNLTKI